MKVVGMVIFIQFVSSKMNFYIFFCMIDFIILLLRVVMYIDRKVLMKRQIEWRNNSFICFVYILGKRIFNSFYVCEMNIQFNVVVFCFIFDFVLEGIKVNFVFFKFWFCSLFNIFCKMLGLYFFMR